MGLRARVVALTCNVEVAHGANGDGPKGFDSMSNVGTIATLLAALGDETRLRIVQRLSSGPSLSIARLSHGTHLTRQAITKHLAVLARAGLVRDKWSGRERLWRFDGRRLADVRHFLERVCAHWEEALGRSKDVADD